MELERVIEDLRTALERDPKKPDLWQVLGDAYMKNDQLTEAIDAYKRGMEVV
jgi:cytochrome c-type biogenesis protein CcmH/NrfG